MSHCSPIATLRRSRISRILAVAPIALAISATPALADDGEPTKRHAASLTFSPIHLLFPVVEIQGEFAVTPRVGVAVIGGIGQVTLETSSGDSTLTAYEVGAKFVGYVLGDFEEGMQVGLEVLYVGIGGEANDGDETVSVLGEGLALSPLIGYKIIADIGFTFEAQAGPSLVFVSAEADNGDSKTEVSILPMLNLNVGWSF